MAKHIRGVGRVSPFHRLDGENLEHPAGVAAIAVRHAYNALRLPLRRHELLPEHSPVRRLEVLLPVAHPLGGVELLLRHAPPVIHRLLIIAPRHFSKLLYLQTTRTRTPLSLVSTASYLKYSSSYVLLKQEFIWLLHEAH